MNRKLPLHKVEIFSNSGNLGVIPISRNKVSNWLEDFCEELFLEIAANHMMVSKIERTVLRKKIKKNLMLYFLKLV